MKRALTFSALALALLFAPAAPAHALGGGILGCGAAEAGSAVTQAAASAVGSLHAVPVTDKITNRNTTILKTKECVLDGLGIALAKGMISALTINIVDWINGGFEGSPAFVTDLHGFLGDIADQTSLDFIRGTELGFLCTPFSVDIRLALAVQRQPFRERIRCSLGDVTDNASAFFSGDFSQGGWPAWFRVHTSFKNNPYGAYLLASSELDVRIAGRRSEELQLLSFGDGFFSKGKCRLDSSSVKSKNAVNHLGTNDPISITPDTTTENGCLSAGGAWDIVTPGGQIAAQLENVLGSGVRQLELADEFDEIINALIAQLGQQALTSLDGLRGLSSRSSSSAVARTNADGTRTTGSYLEALVAESEDSSLTAARQTLVSDIDSALSLEEEYQDALAGLIANTEAARGEFGSQYACYFTGGSAPGTPTAGTFETTLAGENAARAVSTETTSRLLAVRAEANGARDSASLNAAADTYDAILSEGTVHSSADIVFINADLDGQTTTLETLRADPEALGACSLTP